MAGPPRSSRQASQLLGDLCSRPSHRLNRSLHDGPSTVYDPISCQHQARLFSSSLRASRTPTPTNTFSPSNAPGFEPSASSRPAGETPRERVARLREANRRAKLAQQPAFERWLDRSRGWADNIHRTGAYALIGMTIIAGVVGSFAVGDMVMHNRRKRNEYYAALREIHDKTVEEAKEAKSLGTADEAQLRFLENELTREAEKEEIARKKAEKRGFFKRIRNLFGGVSTPPPDDTIMAASESRPEVVLGEDKNEGEILEEDQVEAYWTKWHRTTPYG